MIRFLSLAEVLELHRYQLEAWGGQEGVRSQPLLESAVAMAEATFGGEHLHVDLFEMAAAYAFHLAENQCFLDGNKRTGLHAALVFLELNDVQIDDPEGRLYEAMIALSARTLDRVTAPRRDDLPVTRMGEWRHRV